MSVNKSEGPLAGLKVVDFSTLLPGPYASMLLADMGADVIRVESPTRPDLVKSLPPMVGDRSAADLQLNRNKRSIAIDLKSTEGKKIALSLIADADVLLEQFRPGVMARFGLSYDDLCESHPKLVYCSITGYGQTGPWAPRAGHDLNYLSIAGLSSYTGRDREGPLPLAAQFADIAGGSHQAVMGILAAVIAAQRTGHGSHVDVSMTDAMFAMNGMTGAGALASGVDPERESEMLNGGSFYDYYRCGDDRYIAVAGLEPQFVDALADCLARHDLRALQNLHDREVQRKLKGELRQIFVTQNREYWLDLFADKDVCVTSVLTINEAAAHPQIESREMVIDTFVGDQAVRQLAHPIKFSAFPTTGQHKQAPETGKHTISEMKRLGYSSALIEALLDDLVIYSPDH